MEPSHAQLSTPKPTETPTPGVLNTQGTVHGLLGTRAAEQEVSGR